MVPVSSEVVSVGAGAVPVDVSVVPASGAVTVPESVPVEVPESGGVPVSGAVVVSPPVLVVSAPTFSVGVPTASLVGIVVSEGGVPVPEVVSPVPPPEVVPDVSVVPVPPSPIGGGWTVSGA